MEITHVVRGEEHLVNTPKQVLLYEALGLEPPQFAHLPLMLGSDGKKLSKRTGDTALGDYRDAGFPPEAVVNFLALQGWALDGATEVFSVEQMIEAFDLKDVSKGGSIFDVEKFRWMSGEYIRADDVAHLAERCAPFVIQAGLMGRADIAQRAEWYRAVVASEQERIETYADLPERIRYLFVDDDAVVFDPKAEKGARKHEGGPDTLRAFAQWVRERLEGGLAPSALGDGAKAWVQERGLKIPALFQPLRCALTGRGGGPDLFQIMELLGPEASLRRIEIGAERLS
jgi:nondiscriminating glutamyl-tRNA synthetase